MSCTSSNFKLNFIDDTHFNEHTYNNPLPFADSNLYFTSITDAKLLTKGDNVKTVFDLTFNIEDVNYQYEPGSSIGIIPFNDEDEVNDLLNLLNITSIADKLFQIELSKSSKKKLPTYVPDMTTIRYLLLKHLDIRSPPKKLFLKSLIKFTSNGSEIERLNNLCLPKGDYANFINTSGRTLLKVLKLFPSCKPPPELLLEHLPALLPRPYSVASSPLTTTKFLHVIFTVVTFEDGRKGICSGWLEKQVKKFLSKTLEENLNCLKLIDEIRIPFYFRKPNNFQLPKSPLTPIIMIGPGTGIAPFLSFLEHRHLQAQFQYGSSWLFYGCRYSDRDFLYKDKINEYLELNVLSTLFVAFSREQKEIYIQKEIELNAENFVSKLVNDNAVVYICGDAKNIIKEIKEVIISCLVKCACFNNDEAEDYISNMQKSNRYIQDAWI